MKDDGSTCRLCGARSHNKDRCPDSQCTVCGRKIRLHTGKQCPWCYGPLEHCDPKRQQAEKEGVARMAAAREPMMRTERDWEAMNG